jgi:hypothetical protein
MVPACNPPAAVLNTAPHEGGPLSADEERVKAYVLDNAGDPKSVQFVRWGPNLSGEEYRKIVTEAAAKWERYFDQLEAKRNPDMGDVTTLRFDSPAMKAVKDPNLGNFRATVRVRSRIANQTGGMEVRDETYRVENDGRVLPTGEGSDNWPALLARSLAPQQKP